MDFLWVIVDYNNTLSIKINETGLKFLNQNKLFQVTRCVYLIRVEIFGHAFTCDSVL